MRAELAVDADLAPTGGLAIRALIATAVSTDGSDYLAWQIELLSYTHWRVRQPGALVVLTDTVHVGGDDYAPYNKPYALMRWLDREEPEAGTVLVLDPDMVFVQPLAREVEPGRPVAHSSLYSVGADLERLLRPHTSRPEALQPLAVPMLVHRDDLRALAPAWFEYTMRLRADDAVRALIPWVCEMWACSIAAYELGLEFELKQNAEVPPFSSQARLPLIHYAWTVGDFDKRSYRPWDMPPDTNNDCYRKLQALIAEFRERNGWVDRPGPRVTES
jgi:hypothetical protein